MRLLLRTGIMLTAISICMGTIALPAQPACRDHGREWLPPGDWTNASYCPRLHPIHCGVYDPSGTIAINGTYFIFPDGAPSNTHWASRDLLHWSLRNQSWFNGLTGGISATPSGIYAHWVPNNRPDSHNYPERAVNSPGGHGLSALDRWVCNATTHNCGHPVSGSASVLEGLHDAGRALQLEPGGPWFLVAGGPGSSWGRANPATIWLIEADNDTLASFHSGGPFFRLLESDGSVNGGIWKNESVLLGTLECAEVFRMGPEKFVITAGVYRKTYTQSSEWFVGTKLRNTSSAVGWSFSLEKRGHVDWGQYYSAKVAREAYPTAVGCGRHVVFGEATPIGTSSSAPSWMEVCGSHHTFPRDLHLDADLGLRVQAIPELETLRKPGSHIVRTSIAENSPPMRLGSQCEITLDCRYNPATAAKGSISFGVDVLVSPDGRERLRIGFTDVSIPTAGPGLRMFVDHTKCCNHGEGVTPNCSATQNAPLPSIVAGDNVTMRILVDGGLVEVYGMNAVVLTAVAAPSSNVAPHQRTVQAFVEDKSTAAISQCSIEGWALSL